MPGEQGRREFQAEIKRLFQIPDDVQFEVNAGMGGCRAVLCSIEAFSDDFCGVTATASYAFPSPSMDEMYVDPAPTE